jgi:hypothetical protein
MPSVQQATQTISHSRLSNKNDIIIIIIIIDTRTRKFENILKSEQLEFIWKLFTAIIDTVDSR